MTADGWYKLTTPGRLLWAPRGARRWRDTGWFVRDNHLWHGQADNQPADAVDQIERLLLLGVWQQEDDRLARRAADARRRRAAMKAPHPPKRCACCGEKFTPKRTDARCCSGKCRAKLSRLEAKAKADS